MLKIKDNLDLKELEKFDFKYNDNTGKYMFYERNLLGKTYIVINSWNRKIIYIQSEENDTICLKKIYDLIKADLVEKVDN